MEHLISLLFFARDITHREHLKTKSYAQHMALNGFYSAIVDNADAIAEAYQGKYGLLENMAILGHSGDMSIVDELTGHLEWIKENRYKVCAKEHTAIQNLIDVVEETYLSTLYKLRFLS